MKKERTKHTSLGKGFINPFVEPDYYKKVTYDEFFQTINKELLDYTVLVSADHLKPIRDTDLVINKNPHEMSCEEFMAWRAPSVSEKELTARLKQLVPYCPDLWESNNPTARLLVKHFGRLLNTALHGKYKERKKAASDINDITTSRPKDAKWKKKYIPPFLSLNDMYECIHKITKYLRTQCTKAYPDELLTEKDIEDISILEGLKEVDPRLVDIVQKGQTKTLIGATKTLTKELIADFLGLTLNGLEQQLKPKKSI